MKRLLFGKVVFVASLVTLAYFGLSWFMPTEILITAFNGATMGAAVLVAAIYAPLFWQSTWRLESRVGLLAIGMGCLFASLIGSKGLSAYYRAVGETDKLPDHVLVGFFTLVGVIGIVLQVVAPGYPPQGFREKFGGRYRWLISFAVVGGAIAALFATFVMSL